MALTRALITRISGQGVPVRGNDIDTDRIIPARFLKCVTFDGLGAYAFYDVRFDENGSPKAHPFNDPKFSGANIMVVNKNFGCGSSREHAPQALEKYGIKAIVGESFAEIFAGNCAAMGIPAVIVSSEAAIEIQNKLDSDSRIALTVDLQTMRLKCGETNYNIELPESTRNMLTKGTWDSTGVLLENKNKVEDLAKSLPYVSGY